MNTPKISIAIKSAIAAAKLMLPLDADTPTSRVQVFQVAHTTALSLMCKDTTVPLEPQITTKVIKAVGKLVKALLDGTSDLVIAPPCTLVSPLNDCAFSEAHRAARQTALLMKSQGKSAPTIFTKARKNAIRAAFTNPRMVKPPSMLERIIKDVRTAVYDVLDDTYGETECKSSVRDHEVLCLPPPSDTQDSKKLPTISED